MKFIKDVYKPFVKDSRVPAGFLYCFQPAQRFCCIRVILVDLQQSIERYAVKKKNEKPGFTTEATQLKSIEYNTSSICISTNKSTQLGRIEHLFRSHKQSSCPENLFGIKNAAHHIQESGRTINTSKLVYKEFQKHSI